MRTITVEQRFGGASGRWAGEQFIRAAEQGKELSPQLLRTAGVLRKDEWVFFDDTIIAENAIRLRGVADCISAGLVVPVAGSMGKTVYQYEKVSDMNPAQRSLSGVSRSEKDRQEFDLGNLPLPITHKDFDLSLRHLTASRTRGESLDTSQARVAARLVTESIEGLLFNGSGDETYGGYPIYGYTTHPDRNTLDFEDAGEGWQATTKDPEECLTDVLNMIEALRADRMYGPYNLYLPGDASTILGKDFKAASDKTLRQRLLEIEGLQKIEVVDSLATENNVMVQMTPDVVVMVDGEPIQSIQWDIEGGFTIKMKVMQIMVPLIRSDYTKRSGVCHMRPAA